MASLQLLLLKGATSNFSLTYPAQITVSTRLDIKKSLTIDGPGILQLRVFKTAANPDSVFMVMTCREASAQVEAPKVVDLFSGKKG